MMSFHRFRSLLRPSGYAHLGGEYFFDMRRMRKKRITPNLFIIGAQKCGTSSLHAYLDQHPDIFMSKPRKEPGYYVVWPEIRDYYKKKKVNYLSRSDLLKMGMLKGYQNQPIFGESSTFYSNGTHNITEENFKENNIDLNSIRIIYLMKNPIERIISHFLHAVRYNDFTDDINSFVRTNPEAIGISMYGKQIAGYYNYLPAEQILLLKFETFIAQPQEVLNKVYDFLNVGRYKHEEFGIYNAAPRSQESQRNSINWDEQVYTTILKALKEDRKVLQKYANMELYNWSIPNVDALSNSSTN